jgi:AcrR family transcriptional regulator
MSDAAPPDAPRRGRPPAKAAGEVEARLLDAATAVFLDKGFEGASLEQIAERAHAGKATLYARYANKEALFTAVIRRSVERVIGRTAQIDAAAPVAERVRHVAASMVRETLRPDVVALMRLIVAEAHRFPALARQADRIGWEGGVRRVAEAMLGTPAEDAALARFTPAAGRFVDLMFVPLQMRALLGEELAVLHAEAERSIAFALDVLRFTGELPSDDSAPCVSSS